LSINIVSLRSIFKKECEMNPLRQYSIPFKGLNNGLYQFDFQIDKSFFALFEDSPIQDGDFAVRLDFDKKHNFFELVFDFEGTIKTDCDRCLAPINLPISDRQPLLVKLSVEPQPEEAEIVYISPEDSDFNVAQYIYEFLCLAVPYNLVYNCEKDKPRPCDLNLLEKLGENNQRIEPNTNDTASLWDDIKSKISDN
jgi:uncharacterized protein